MIHVENLEYRYPGAGKSTTQNRLIKLLDNYYGKPLNTFGTEYYERIGVGFSLRYIKQKLEISMIC